MSDSQHRKFPLPFKFCCGTPREHCSGQTLPSSAGLKEKATRGHDSAEAAFKCHKRYLMIVCGYTLGTDSRSLVSPEGPVLVLTKPSRFGERMRGGKGTRWMPPKKAGYKRGSRGALVVSL